MKFVIWGAGIRGKKLMEFLGKKNVLAFIDSSKSLKGTTYKGVKIIDYGEYSLNYNDCIIIISLRRFEEIVYFLKEKKTVPYFILSECPPEFYYNIETFSFDDIEIKFGKKEQIVIYGISLFSVLFYKYLRGKGYKNLYFYSDKNFSMKKFLLEMDKKIKFITVGELSNDIHRILYMKKDKEDLSLFCTNYLIDDFFNLSYRLLKYQNSKLQIFKNLHRGKRCFVVATGPSLKISDLEILKKNNDFSISVNMIYRIFPFTSWRPQYYVMDDPQGLRLYGDEITELNLQNMFISDNCLEFWQRKMSNNYYKYHSIASENLLRVPDFSEDFQRGLYSIGTVIYSCLQIAVYMGFKKIFLIGVDCNYEGKIQNKCNHFIENYFKENDNQPHQFQYKESFLAYQTARIYAEQHGIKIYNATRGGKLEIFERIDFDSLFK